MYQAFAPTSVYPSGQAGTSVPAFFVLWYSFQMRKVVAYIDGFNLYHAIDDLRKPYLKWLDLHALARSICGNDETLVGVKYFSAYATWKLELSVDTARISPHSNMQASSV
ncbi:MAG: hypothetical protein QOK29_5139 [Rhodospirillaceae bacterium]|jgi:hypothetical protein|nr:hypothetical protein [Rhodospirillaceae bacterium]